EPDAKVSVVKVYWNERTDSLVQTLTTPMDTLKVSIDGLAEGDYALEVLTFDKAGASSGKVLLRGIVYGEEYVGDWDKRTLYDMNFQSGSASLALVWGETTDLRIAGSEVWYTDADGTEQRKFFEHSALNGALEN